jgi:hypothetical protein
MISESRLALQPNLYDAYSASICPLIGSTLWVKAARTNITSRLDIAREMLFEKHDLTSSLFSLVVRRNNHEMLLNEAGEHYRSCP